MSPLTQTCSNRSSQYTRSWAVTRFLESLSTAFLTSRRSNSRPLGPFSMLEPAKWSKVTHLWTISNRLIYSYNQRRHALRNVSVGQTSTRSSSWFSKKRSLSSTRHSCWIMRKVESVRSFTRTTSKTWSFCTGCIAHLRRVWSLSQIDSSSSWRRSAKRSSKRPRRRQEMAKRRALKPSWPIPSSSRKL